MANETDKKRVAKMYDPEKSIVDNLAAMSEQRDINEVAKECYAVFSVDGQWFDKLLAFKDDDPLRAALNYSRIYNRTCMVIFEDKFFKVPGFDENMGGWVQCMILEKLLSRRIERGL